MFRTKTPREVRIPWWLGLTIGAVTLGGAVYGWRQRQKTVIGAGENPPAPQRAAQAVFIGAGMGYLTTSLVDFWEHFRLEKEETGRYWSFQVVPPGETLNHLSTISILLGLFALARPLPRQRLEPRDWFVLLGPSLFLSLGWRDELVYHRRRAAHREDMMHTIAHLAVGVMLTGFYLTRVVPWSAARPRIEEWLENPLKEQRRGATLEQSSSGQASWLPGPV
jgi:hypothetical protein